MNIFSVGDDHSPHNPSRIKERFEGLWELLIALLTVVAIAISLSSLSVHLKEAQAVRDAAFPKEVGDVGASSMQVADHGAAPDLSRSN